MQGPWIRSCAGALGPDPCGGLESGAVRAALAFIDQERGWFEKPQVLYRDLLRSAIEVINCDTEGKGYHLGLMHNRNRYMVNNSDLQPALWNCDKTGGTYDAVKYARTQGSLFITRISAG